MKPSEQAGFESRRVVRSYGVGVGDDLLAFSRSQSRSNSPLPEELSVYDNAADSLRGQSQGSAQSALSLDGSARSAARVASDAAARMQAAQTAAASMYLDSRLRSRMARAATSETALLHAWFSYDSSLLLAADVQGVAVRKLAEPLGRDRRNVTSSYATVRSVPNLGGERRARELSHRQPSRLGRPVVPATLSAPSRPPRATRTWERAFSREASRHGLMLQPLQGSRLPVGRTISALDRPACLRKLRETVGCEIEALK